MPKTYLLSRTLDPLLGVFTGFLAYYLHETNPRTAPPPGHSLRDLLGWQWDRTQQHRAQRAVAVAAVETSGEDAAVLEAVRRELEGETVVAVVEEVPRVNAQVQAKAQTAERAV
jgi:hypothetical protein